MTKINQNTLNDTVKLAGIGLHSGVKSEILIKPADADHGIKFKRVDIKADNIIDASHANVIDPVLCTKIKNTSGVSVSTVEHLMAAFYGEQIDNVLIEINAEEVPIMDGSALEFVEAIKSAGIKKQNNLRKFIKVLKKVEIVEGSKYISIEPYDKDLIIDFEIVYDNPLIRTRRKEFKLSTGDLNSIYSSRTFCLYEDIDKIKSLGLAKGGSLENAIVVQGNKILNEEGLRNRHEFVLHKILDCLGDVLLSGHRIFGHIKTSQGGHQLTNTLLRKLLSDNSNWVLASYSDEQKNVKDSTYNERVAVSA